MLVDGEPRVACVTPATRVAGRTVTTVDGLDAAVRDPLADALLACGGSQCGFCTPGIIVRAAALAARNKTGRVQLDRALAAHLCRCTGWQTVYDALETAALETAARETAALETAAPIHLSFIHSSQRIHLERSPGVANRTTRLWLLYIRRLSVGATLVRWRKI